MIEKDFFVKIRYQLEIEDGNGPEWLFKEMETSFILGREPIPRVIEEAIRGKQPGDLVRVSLPPERAFGPYLSCLVKEVEIGNFKNPETLREGEWYEETSPYGSKILFKVIEIKGDKVKVDFNHPAAGKTVVVNIKILEARPATPYEIMSAEIRACSSG